MKNLNFISKIKNSDFKGVIKRIEKVFGKNNLKRVRVDAKIEVEEKDRSRQKGERVVDILYPDKKKKRK